MLRGLLTAGWTLAAAAAVVLMVQLHVTFAPINLKTVNDLSVLLAPRMLLSAIPDALAMVCAIRVAMPVGGNGCRVSGV